jgi:hypothetical protein
MNKSSPAPNVPGNTDAERMDNALRKILTVSKDDLLKEEANWKPGAGAKEALLSVGLSRRFQPIGPVLDLSTIFLPKLE